MVYIYMKINTTLSIMTLAMALTAARCKAEPVWANGNSLMEVMRFDIEAHDANHQLTDYQTNAVCLLLGYFRGFAEAAALSAHYNSTALPFFLPENITNEEIERVVYNYLADNPDKLNMNGGVLIVAALSKKFPNLVFKPPAGAATTQVPGPFFKPFDGLSNALLSGS